MLDIQKNVKLADYSTFKIGGPAREFVAVQKEEELLEALNYAKKNNFKFFILGQGSNILFSDDGFDGLVIKMQDSSCLVRSISIECGAGLPLAQAVSAARDNLLSGLEWAVGIPGTVGGAVSGNAGAFEKTVADVIESVKVFDVEKSEVIKYGLSGCEFGYRNSIFKKNRELIVISATIKLQREERGKIEEKMKEFIKKRNSKQPKGWYGSAGSFFENPVVNNPEIIARFENDKKVKSKDNRIPAGWLIEEAGLKGKKIGQVMISQENSNFLINTGGATAENIIIAASAIKQKVRDEFGVNLKEEVKIVNNN